jgi:hypothetical protein
LETATHHDSIEIDMKTLRQRVKLSPVRRSRPMCVL